MKHLNALIENSKQAIRYWWLLLLAGIVLLLTGILVFIFPGRSYLGMSLLFGWVILLAGILEVVISTANRHFITGRGWMLAGGIIQIVLGVILIFNVGLSASMLPFFLGFWLLMRAFSTIGLGGDMHTMGISGSDGPSSRAYCCCSARWESSSNPSGSAPRPSSSGSASRCSSPGAAACTLALQLRNAHLCFEE